jgi:hypothetical protein
MLPSAHHDNQIGYNKGYKVNHLWASIWGGVLNVSQKILMDQSKWLLSTSPKKKLKLLGVPLN